MQDFPLGGPGDFPSSGPLQGRTGGTVDRLLRVLLPGSKLSGFDAAVAFPGNVNSES